MKNILGVVLVCVILTMAMRISPPEFSKSKSYERYKQEIAAWREVTDLQKEKRGIAIALSLPENDNIREKVFDELDINDLKKADGLDTLIQFLDLHLGKDDLADSLEKFEDFEDFSREKGQSIANFISLFDQKYHKIAKKDMALPPAILAFKLLKCANITKAEKMLVLTGIDYSRPEEMYEQAKRSLKKFKGEDAGCGEYSGSASNGPAIKVEKDSAFLAENEVYTTRFNYQRRPFGRGHGGRYTNGRSQGRGFNHDYHRGAYQGHNSFNQPKRERPVNPTGPDGRPLTCRSCGSFRHLMAKCPDSWENMGSTNIVDSFNENIVLFTGYNKEDISLLGRDAHNSAVLDSACSSTVCGQKWFKGYYDSLSDCDKGKVVQSCGQKVFKFGGGEQLRSLASCEIPAVLAGNHVMIKTDVVESDIPLLLSIDSMKRAKIKLDLENDTAEILGTKINLNHTSSGHYCVPIDNAQEICVESVCQVQLHLLNEKEQNNALLKLHRQFAHPPAFKLESLLKDAGVWREEFAERIQRINDSCDLCKAYKKTPARPVVALPMATRFNEKVAIDLKQWNNRWILHMVDMFSRFTISVFIDSKKPSVIIDKIMTHWVGAAFGVMEAILTDNGGEFSNEELREVASILNVQVCTTAAYSPFQNGLCERIHAVTDNMLLKLCDQYPETSIEVLLAWANMARNSLQMWHGYSSYQIVFGKNPNLPNIMSERVPALAGKTSSETFAKHLNILHASRQAFIQSESDERIRRALRSKIRASEVVFENGDRVYYKRENQTKWLGPGKVVFQDGKIVFVRHGGVFIRASPNRIIKLHSEFSKHEENPEESIVKEKSDQSRNDNSPENDESKNKILAEVIPAQTADVQTQDHRMVVNDSQGIDCPQNEQISGQSTTIESSDLWTKLLKKGDRIRYKSENNDWNDATILSRAGKSKGPLNKWYNIRDDITKREFSIDLSSDSAWYPVMEENVNVVMIPKRQQNTDTCIQAKNDELVKLKSFETYEEVKDVGQSKISTTWVLWKKGEGVRARLVARGFEEQNTSDKDSPTVSKSTMRVFLALAAHMQWTINTTDIKSAFLQSKCLDRDVFIDPPPEANCAVGYIWKLKRCLYGLNDAARQFFDSVCSFLKGLGCEQSCYDPALFFFRKNNRVIGFLISHIDDFLHAGEADFEAEVMNKLRERFVAGKLENKNFQYVGFHMAQTKEGIMLDQANYLDNLDIPEKSSRRLSRKNDPLSEQEMTEYRSLVGRLNWIVQGTRPDLVYEMTELSMFFNRCTVSNLDRAIKTLKKLQIEPAKIFFPALGNRESWRISVYTDAAHANLPDGVSSMGAQIVFLVDANGLSCPLSWHAGKIKRVVKSTIAAEALSLLEGIELAIYLKSLLQSLVSDNVQFDINAIIDNKSVVEAVYSTKMIDDKRLRIDISAIKQFIDNGEIASVSWCPGKNQLADAMTKKGASNKNLLHVLQTGLMKGEDGAETGY